MFNRQKAPAGADVCVRTAYYSRQYLSAEHTPALSFLLSFSSTTVEVYAINKIWETGILTMPAKRKTTEGKMKFADMKKKKTEKEEDLNSSPPKKKRSSSSLQD